MIPLKEIEAARDLLRGVIIPTPVLPSFRLSDDMGGQIFVKAENTQRGGSFKIRGAYTKLNSLTPEQRRRGVIAASMGNHAQGVALAAQMLNVPAMVVMPEDAPLAKITATKRYGARVILHGKSFDEANAYARELQKEHDLTFVHAFDDPAIVAGQGTIGLELAEAIPDLDTVIVPVGGGGLIGGIASALRAVKPGTRIIGVQAAGCAPVPLSLDIGQPEAVPQARTIADGIAVKKPGNVTFPLIQALVDEVVTVEDETIARAIVYSLQHLGLVVEGAGAVGIAALIGGQVQPRSNKPLCVVLSGGNIDSNFLARVIEQVLVKQGRYLVLHTSVPDKPGNLARLTRYIADTGANVLDIQHRRAAWQVPLDRTGIELLLEVRDEAHAQQVIEQLTEAGYPLERIGAGEYPV